MEQLLRRTWAEIDLDALCHNYGCLRGRSGARVLGVVKADAYGHGAIQVARLLEGRCAFFGVSSMLEAMELRQAGLHTPILILGASMDTHIDCILDYGLTPTVFSAHTLGRLQAAAAERGKTCRFHFKVDTGMNRIGFVDTEAFEAALLPSIPAEIASGMFRDGSAVAAP